MWSLGLRLDAHGGGGGGGGDTSYLCSTTVSSASLRSPWGRRAIGRVGARRFDAAGVSNAPRRRARTTEAQASSHRTCRPGCGVRRRPAPAADPPGCLGGVRRWRLWFPLTSSASAAVAGLGFARTALLHLYYNQLQNRSSGYIVFVYR